MTLREQGWSFVLRGSTFLWVDPALLLPSDIDCTEMADADLQKLFDELDSRA